MGSQKLKYSPMPSIFQEIYAFWQVVAKKYPVTEKCCCTNFKNGKKYLNSYSSIRPFLPTIADALMTLFSLPSLRSVAVFSLLCTAGFLGNWFRLPLFFNVDFLFGSFFVMLAILRFGVLPALLVGMAAASSTWLLWNHPWAIVIFSAEALWVALANRRKPGHLILFDTLYWLCLGMPLIWLLYHLGMGMSSQATLLVALKQSINGISNVLLVTFCLNIYKLATADGGERKALLSMQEILFIAFVMAALLPAFVYLVLDVRGRSRNDELDICRRVRSIAESSQDILETWLSTNHQTVIALSRLIGDPNTASAEAMQRQVEALHLANPNLKRLGVTDRNDLTVAFSPAIDDLGQTTIGQNLSDRPFVAVMRRTLQPRISDVVRGRIGQPGPRLALVVPFVIDGRYQGHCIGSVDFDKLSEQMRILVRNRYADITVLDRERKVVVSTSGQRKPMELFARPAGGELLTLADDIQRWLPALERNSSVMLRWQRSLVVKEVQLSPETPWTIVVEASPVPYFALLSQHTIDMLLLLWGIILFTLMVSHLLSLRIVSGLRRLEAVTNDLPHRWVDGVSNWPTSNIKELHSLIVNFQNMTAALNASFKDMLALNRTLEERVEKRTIALRESEEQYRRVVNTASEGIWIADQNLITTYVNPRMAEILGYRGEEMIGRSIESFIAPEHLPDFAERIRSRMLDRHEQFERCIRRKDGSEIWLQMSAVPMLDAGNQFVGTFAMCSDITERKRIEKALLDSNQLLQMTLASLNEAVFIVPTGARIIQSCNLTVEKMFGYTCEELIGVSPDCLHVDEEMSQRFVAGMCQGYEQRGYFETTFRMRRKDGTIFDSEHYVSPIRDEHGNIASHVCVVRDISERKKAEEALALKQSELEMLNHSLESRIRQAVAELRQKDQVMILQSRQAAMGEMINNIAHQWRQPLNALGLVLADIKDAHAFNELNQAYLEQSVETGNRLVQQMSATINDFRNFFRPDKERVIFSARRQISEALSLVEESFSNSHIAIRFSPDDDVALYGYPNEFSQVFLNLLSNGREAILASGATSGAICVRLAALDDLGCVTVRDTGGGIPAEIMHKIFEPYFSSKPLGTGIGLYMSKMIIERNMQGRIEAKNVDGGAEFTIYMPLRTSPDVDAPLRG